jgi:hypothetical protein
MASKIEKPHYFVEEINGDHYLCTNRHGHTLKMKSKEAAESFAANMNNSVDRYFSAKNNNFVQN